MDRRQTERLEADAAGLARAAAVLRAGGLVAFPTETVYGLGADARDGRAVAGIFAAKGRPAFNPLIVHVTDLAAATRLAVLPEAARRLAGAFWPGPLTLVLPLRPDAGLSSLVTAGLPTVGLRVPAHPVAQALLVAAGCPVAAPSANPSGRVSPTTAGHVLAGLSGRIDAVLDGGACPLGLESTIVGFDPDPVILRPGGVTAEALADALGGRVVPTAAPDGARPTAPGQLASHYAPRAPLRLDAAAPRPGERFVGFGPPPPGVVPAFSLSPAGDPVEAAARLFAVLHALDAGGDGPVAVAPVPDTGLGRAINDRLRRAAAPRG
ncbi:MAG: L-threonylcarbamoyladenylate synthase [Rhodobacteraceae bacterium]|jgi:L-threonylcarbamoyladenylate synthase|nr:L-threonylcarbamoyladenylate synthase [Paracoccaceae bacterium]